MRGNRDELQCDKPPLDGDGDGDSDTNGQRWTFEPGYAC